MPAEASLLLTVNLLQLLPTGGDAKPVQQARMHILTAGGRIDKSLHGGEEPVGDVLLALEAAAEGDDGADLAAGELALRLLQRHLRGVVRLDPSVDIRSIAYDHRIEEGRRCSRRPASLPELAVVALRAAVARVVAEDRLPGALRSARFLCHLHMM